MVIVACLRVHACSPGTARSGMSQIFKNLQNWLISRFCIWISNRTFINFRSRISNQIQNQSLSRSHTLESRIRCLHQNNGKWPPRPSRPPCREPKHAKIPLTLTSRGAQETFFDFVVSCWRKIVLYNSNWCRAKREKTRSMLPLPYHMWGKCTWKYIQKSEIISEFINFQFRKINYVYPDATTFRSRI